MGASPDSTVAAVTGPRPRPATARPGVIGRATRPLALAFLLAACGSGGGGGSGPSPNAPRIENLRVSYVPANPVPGVVTQIGFIVDVVDSDGDWVNGRCHFVTGDQLVLPIRTAAGVPTNATSGTATCFYTAAFQGEDNRVDLAVRDRAGNQSNVLTAAVTLERIRSRPR